MSTQQNPIGTMFELQRTTIENTQEMIHQTVDAQVRAADMFAEAIERGDAAREQGEDVTVAAVDAYFDAMASVVPGDAEGVEGLRETVLEQVEVAGEINEDVWEATQEFAEQNAATFEEFAAEFETMVDDSFDAFLRTHEQTAAGTQRATDAVQQQAQVATEIAVEGVEQATEAVEESAE